MSFSAINGSGVGFRAVSHLLLRDWLVVCLPMGGGEWLTLHHLFCYLLLFFHCSFTYQTSLSWSLSFIAFTLPFLFSHPSVAGESEQAAMSNWAACWGSTHCNGKSRLCFFIFLRMLKLKRRTPRNLILWPLCGHSKRRHILLLLKLHHCTVFQFQQAINGARKKDAQP